MSTPTPAWGPMSTRFTDHALEACARRGIDVQVVLLVVEAPERVEAQGRRQVLQSVLRLPPDGARYVVRVVTEQDGAHTVIVTAYRTTKFEKYGASR